ncbi:MAG TPA: F0F1 ATP synthase subunit delta [Candidatus Saccharibacteria bacterium]|mgnify:FL=1|nr:F0F1 ATP synthase subunit delta [Candidatus Saccharibacteria bacterium]HRK93780.1 F0F1 ATP synthase subunit delta [Candidatus Saccharibacteria bacterium]
MKLSLPDTVASQQDLASLISEVHAYAKWASHELIKQKVSVKTGTPQPAISAAASQLIRDWSGGKPLTQTSIDSLLKELDEYKKTAPSMTITLAAVAPNEVKAKLVGWARANLAPNMLVSFQMNRHILGGMVVNYGSHIFDWSFRRKLLSAEKPFHEVFVNV